MRGLASLLFIASFSLALSTSLTERVFAETAAKAGAPQLTKDGKPRGKDVRAACKTEANAKGLAKGDAYRAFMKECIGKQRPDLVKSYDCRQEAKAKKLEKDERKSFMKQCKARP